MAYRCHHRCQLLQRGGGPVPTVSQQGRIRGLKDVGGVDAVVVEVGVVEGRHNLGGGGLEGARRRSEVRQGWVRGQGMCGCSCTSCGKRSSCKGPPQWAATIRG